MYSHLNLKTWPFINKMYYWHFKHSISYFKTIIGSKCPFSIVLPLGPCAPVWVPLQSHKFFAPSTPSTPSTNSTTWNQDWHNYRPMQITSMETEVFSTSWNPWLHHHFNGFSQPPSCKLNKHYYRIKVSLVSPLFLFSVFSSSLIWLQILKMCLLHTYCALCWLSSMHVCVWYTLINPLQCVSSTCKSVKVWRTFCLFPDRTLSPICNKHLIAHCKYFIAFFPICCTF